MPDWPWVAADWPWVAAAGVEVLALAIGGIVGGVLGYDMARTLDAAASYSRGGAMGGVVAVVVASIGQMIILRRNGRKVGWWILVATVVEIAVAAVTGAVGVAVGWEGNEAWGWARSWATGVVVSRAIWLLLWLGYLS